MDSGYLVQILEQFGQNPAQARKALRTAWEQTAPERFRSSIVPVLTQTPEGPAQRFLVSFLLQNDRLDRALAEESSFTRDEAVALARAAHKVDPSLDTRLAMQLASHSDSEQDARRILEILEAISLPGNLLPMLGAIMQHPDAHVRSKAALLMGKGNRNPGWVRQQLSEPDTRVRANAVEALWGLDTAEACELFRTAASNSHQRTAINGMLGLYLCGRTEAVRLLAEAAGRDSVAFRASAAWGMGRTQDPRFVPILTRLVRDADTIVRSNSLKALARIRSYRALIQKQGAFDLRLASALRYGNAPLEISGVVRAPGSALATALSPIHFSIEEDGNPVLCYEAQVRHPAETAAGIVLPAPSGSEECDRSLADAWKLLLENKPASQAWAVAAYTNARAARPPAQPAFATAAESVEALRGAFHESPYEGFFPALSGILFQMPLRGEHAILVAGSPVAESGAIVTARHNQMERVIKECAAAAVRITAVVPPVCAPIMRVALSQVAQATGGRYLETAGWQAFAAAIGQAAGTAFPNFSLRYQSRCSSPPGRVRITIASPMGFGECEAEVSG